MEWVNPVSTETQSVLTKGSKPSPCFLMSGINHPFLSDGEDVEAMRV